MTAIPVRWLTVFLDFPAGSFGAGVAFWAALTGWEGQDGDRSALPVRLELRRAALDDRVTGHLAVLPHQTEMADPVGRRYLLT